MIPAACTHNMYPEYRDLTTTGTVAQGYCAHPIQIRKVEQIAVRSCHRPAVKQFYNSKIKFPQPLRVLESPTHANLHHQEHLLLDAGPPCSLVCLNPLFGKTKNKKNPTESPNT